MKKSNQSFNWYGLRQRFSIRKYHFGAASVFIGTSLVFTGGPYIKAAEQKEASPKSAILENKIETSLSKPDEEKRGLVDSEKHTSTNEQNHKTSEVETKITETVTDKVSEKNTEIQQTEIKSKEEKVVSEKTNDVKASSEESKGEIVDTSSSDKEIRLLNTVFVALAGKNLTQAQQDEVLKASELLEKAKEVLAEAKSVQSVNSTTTEVAKIRETLETILAIAEKDSEKDQTKSVSLLEKTVLEAGIINDTAIAYVNKSVKNEQAKSEVIAAVDATKKEIEKANTLIKSSTATAEEKIKQKEVLDESIERVATTLRSSGHGNKIEAILSGEPVAKNNVIIPPKTKTPVQDILNLSDEEIAAIKHEIMNTNPSITDPSMINVVRSGSLNAGSVTVTINGVETRIASGDTIVGTAGTKNIEQLKYSINWFDFASSTITYSDGTVVGPARKLDQPIIKDITYPNGEVVHGKIKMVRDVTYTDGTKGLTTDERFLNSGITKYVEHIYGNGNAQNDHELYEALQEGMKFNVKTKVEGYVLTATVTKLAPKNVKTDPNKTESGPINAIVVFEQVNLQIIKKRMFY